MVKKIKGRGAITAAGTMMQKLQKDKGGGPAGGKGKEGSKKGGLSSIMSTLKMAKKKCVEEDYDDEYDEEDEDDLATDEGTFKHFYMSFDRFLLAVESRDLSQPDKSITPVLYTVNF